MGQGVATTLNGELQKCISKRQLHMAGSFRREAQVKPGTHRIFKWNSLRCGSVA